MQPDTVVQQILNDPTYRRLADFIERQRDEYIRSICAVCEVPAPPFGEQHRAAFVAERFREAGFTDVAIDEVGNVVIIYPGGNRRAGALVVSAHLDTVFPEGTDVRVRRQGNRLLAPGIGDNSASVASLLFLARGLREAEFTPDHELIFLANVGEEGLGDLRGMKHFFGQGAGAQRQVRAVLVLDGPMGMISHRGIGSRRLAVTYRGPGGHSWGDFGRPSAIHALGRAIAAVDAIQVPTRPRTTFNVGVVQGGTSVNAIAEWARMVIDMRSEDADALAQLESQVRQGIQQALAPDLDVEVEVVGDRPIGGIPEDHPLVQLAVAAGRAAGIQVRCAASSTDANLPLSLGIPALALGTKKGGGAHTLGEYVEVDSVVPGFRYAASVLLGFSRWVAQAQVAPM